MTSEWSWATTAAVTIAEMIGTACGLVGRKCGSVTSSASSLEVRVGAGGVVGDVDDVVDFGDGLGDGDFDALAAG